jgi:hypothetical protein
MTFNRLTAAFFQKFRFGSLLRLHFSGQYANPCKVLQQNRPKLARLSHYKGLTDKRNNPGNLKEIESS